MFDVVLTLLKKDFGKVVDFRVPQILTGGKLRARPVYMTAGAGADLCGLWCAIFGKRIFGANNAVNKLGDFVKRINTSVMLRPDLHDDRAEGLRSLRVPSLPALTILFVHNPRRIVILRLVYPGIRCEGLLPARFARTKRIS